jgi:acyl-coenzyme A thioesterase PaaI-like protein
MEADMTSQMRHRLVHAGSIAAALAVLGGVFALYVHPSFLVTLVDQVWSCF